MPLLLCLPTYEENCWQGGEEEYSMPLRWTTTCPCDYEQRTVHHTVGGVGWCVVFSRAHFFVECVLFCQGHSCEVLIFVIVAPCGGFSV